VLAGHARAGYRVKIEVYPVSLSLDADATTLKEVLNSLAALLEYADQLKTYPELQSVEIEQ